MNLGFDLVVESDGPDRAEDAPTSASMRQGARDGERRRPSTDEKKVKNRLRRQAGFDGDEADDLEVVEGRILAAMAQKGRPWAELQALAAELEDIRSERRTAALHRDEIDLADAVIHDHLTPVLTYVQHTAATDWISTTAGGLPDALKDHQFGSDDEEEGDDGDKKSSLTNTAAVEASLWFTRVSAAVKADREEFAEQAQGMAARVAGAYGLRSDVVRRAFLDRVAFLHRQAATDACPNCGSTNLVTKDTKPKGGYVRACGECGTELPETKPKTAEIGPDGVKPWPENEPPNPDPLMAGNATGLADSEQSGTGESSLPEETSADLDPMDSEFWDDGQSHAVPSTRAPNVTGAKTAAEDGGGTTCANCGASIERDPAGEEPRTWHHNDGASHDHEATPSGGEKKESSFRGVTAVDAVDMTEDELDALLDKMYAVPEAPRPPRDDEPFSGNDAKVDYLRSLLGPMVSAADRSGQGVSGLPVEPEGDDVDEAMWPWEIGEIGDKKKKESAVTAGWAEDLVLDTVTGKPNDFYSSGIDNVTRGMLKSVLEGLSPDNATKFAKMPLEQAVALGWRLVSGGVPRAPSTFAGLEERFAAAVIAAETPCTYTDDLGGQCVYAQGHSGPHRPQGGDDDARYQRAKDKFEQEKKGSTAVAQQEQFRSTVQANLARMSEVAR